MQTDQTNSSNPANTLTPDNTTTPTITAQRTNENLRVQKLVDRRMEAVTPDIVFPNNLHEVIESYLRLPQDQVELGSPNAYKQLQQRIEAKIEAYALRDWSNPDLAKSYAKFAASYLKLEKIEGENYINEDNQQAAVNNLNNAFKYLGKIQNSSSIADVIANSDLVPALYLLKEHFPASYQKISAAPKDHPISLVDDALKKLLEADIDPADRIVGLPSFARMYAKLGQEEDIAFTLETAMRLAKQVDSEQDRIQFLPYLGRFLYAENSQGDLDPTTREFIERIVSETKTEFLWSSNDPLHTCEDLSDFANQLQSYFPPRPLEESLDVLRTAWARKDEIQDPKKRLEMAIELNADSARAPINTPLCSWANLHDSINNLRDWKAKTVARLDLLVNVLLDSQTPDPQDIQMAKETITELVGQELPREIDKKHEELRWRFSAVQDFAGLIFQFGEPALEDLNKYCIGVVRSLARTKVDSPDTSRTYKSAHLQELGLSLSYGRSERGSQALIPTLLANSSLTVEDTPTQIRLWCEIIEADILSNGKRKEKLLSSIHNLIGGEHQDSLDGGSVLVPDSFGKIAGIARVALMHERIGERKEAIDSIERARKSAEFRISELEVSFKEGDYKEVTKAVEALVQIGLVAKEMKLDELVQSTSSHIEALIESNLENGEQGEKVLALASAQVALAQLYVKIERRSEGLKLLEQVMDSSRQDFGMMAPGLDASLISDRLALLDEAIDIMAATRLCTQAEHATRIALDIVATSKFYGISKLEIPYKLEELIESNLPAITDWGNLIETDYQGQSRLMSEPPQSLAAAIHRSVHERLIPAIW